MDSMLGLVFAYRSFSGMGELVSPRTTASVPFGGRYRPIDFCLSNLVNAGVSDVGIILRDSYQSLTDHLGSGKDWDLSRKNGGLFLLPPFSYGSEPHHPVTFTGKLDALAGITSYINHSREPYVVLADGDCITNIRLRDVLAHHIASAADITVVCTRRPCGDPAHSVYFGLDAGGRICSVESNPAVPGKNESLGLFILEKKLLLEMIRAGSSQDMVHFERGILRVLLDRLRVLPYFHDGYVARLHTTAMYFKNSMALLDPAVRRDLFDRGNPIRTRVRDDAPTYYSDSAEVRSSLIADGCRIEGTVENSILFRGVKVAPGAVVRNAILMQETSVGKNAALSYCIADKLVTVSAGSDLHGSSTYPFVIAKGKSV